MSLNPSANLPFSRYDYAMQRLRELALPSKIVFDVGAGDGRLSGIESFGFDWNGFDLKSSGNVQRWDLSEPCPVQAEKAAGAVLLLDVIEHCVNPGLALQNIAAATAPGGRLILTTPNARWSASRPHFLLRGTLSGFTRLDLEQNHHLFPLWPHVLEKLLGYAGFAIEEYVTLDGRTKLLGRPGNLFLPARYALNSILLFIEALDPASRGMSCGFVARKVA